MAEHDDAMDIRVEMRVAQFWRKLIGDGEYGKFDPDDLLRWYEALELRGPDEIREVRNERYFTITHGVMQGVVSRAPHPPLWLVNQWLELYEHRTHTGGYWLAAGAFITVSIMVFTNLQGCVNLQSGNPLILHPPPGTPPVAAYSPPAMTLPGVSTSSGIGAYQPRTVARPPTPTLTGPSSNGIAGGATGAVSPTGATGGQNGGASAGATQP